MNLKIKIFFTIVIMSLLVIAGFLYYDTIKQDQTFDETQPSKLSKFLNQSFNIYIKNETKKPFKLDNMEFSSDFELNIYKNKNIKNFDKNTKYEGKGTFSINGRVYKVPEEKYTNSFLIEDLFFIGLPVSSNKTSLKEKLKDIFNLNDTTKKGLSIEIEKVDGLSLESSFYKIYKKNDKTIIEIKEEKGKNGFLTKYKCITEDNKRFLKQIEKLISKDL